MYNQINQLIQKGASKDLIVRPMSYPPSKLQELVSSIIGMLQLAGIVTVFTCDAMLPDQIRENKMMVFFAVWFGGSMVSSAVTKTSAFEIYLGEHLVWSTLTNKRMPNLRDLVDGFEAAGVRLDVH